jgi:outer membrane cobalamin receptor
MVATRSFLASALNATGVLLLLACSTQLPGARVSADSQVITEEEVEASKAVTALEVIQKLRSNFLTYRGETSLDRRKSRPFPTVYIDGQEFGPIGSLGNIPALQVATIRLYRSWEATTVFGSSNTGGVIAITTRR